MRRLWRQLGLIWLMIRFWFGRFKFQRFEFIWGMLTGVVDIGMIGFGWYLVAKNSELPLSPSYIVSYYLMIAVVTGLMFVAWGPGNSLLKEIKDGSFNQYLVKPVNPIASAYANLIGKTVLSRSIYVLAYLIFAVFVLHVGAARVPGIAAVLLIGFLINLGFNIFVASIGFYLVDATGFKNALLHVARLFQGALLPLTLLPIAAQEILRFTPFPNSLYWPIVALRGDVVPVSNLLIGTVWACVLPVVSYWFFKRSLRNYEGVGI